MLHRPVTVTSTATDEMSAFVTPRSAAEIRQNTLDLRIIQERFWGGYGWQIRRVQSCNQSFLEQSVSFGDSAPPSALFLTWPSVGNIAGHLVVNTVGYMTDMSYDPSTIAILRRALDEVLLDERFFRRRSTSALEIAEHLLARAADGERDLERLKSSAFKKLMGNAERGSPNEAA